VPENEKGETMIEQKQTARITAVHREQYDITTEQGILHGKLKTSVYYAKEEYPFPTVGDYVVIDNVDNDYCQIIETLPRKSYFSRVDPGHGGYKEQAIAANFDTVFIMQSLNQNFNLRRIERYLALTWQSGATPVGILTKVDLVDEPEIQINEVETIAAGVDIVATSSKTRAGLDSLEKYLQPGNTCVFLGSSGVGKSSLLNALVGQDIMEVKEIREDDARGRHTTTHRQLVELPCGTYIIDTPGMRELGMLEQSEGMDDSLSDLFEDIESYLGMCKFSDCKHETEPGCAITGAIKAGEITPERWESYQKLKREALYATNKLQAMRARTKESKELATWWRQTKSKKGIW